MKNKGIVFTLEEQALLLVALLLLARESEHLNIKDKKTASRLWDKVKAWKR